MRRPFSALGVMVSSSMSLVTVGARADAPRPTIVVSDVETLHAEVEDPANVGAIIALAPGTYTLARPLRLRTGMDLVGQNAYVDADRDGVWDPVGDGWVAAGATVLDARAMSPVTITVRDCNPTGAIAAAGPEPAVIVGGDNRVRGVTIISAASGIGLGEPGLPWGDPAAPDDDLVSGAGYAATVEDVVLLGGLRGATFGNRGCAAREFSSVLVFDRNVVVGATNGLTLANFATDDAGAAVGPSIDATLRRNRFANNGNGLVALGGSQGTDGATVIVTSIGNLFQQNGGGMFIRAGVSQGSPLQPSSHANYLRLVSTQDRFAGNGSGTFASIALYAADRLVGAAANHGNLLEAHIIAASFTGTAPELDVVGGRYRGTNGLPAGTDNVVRLLVRAARTAALDIIGGDDLPALATPVDPPNRVELVGSEHALDRANGRGSRP